MHLYMIELAQKRGFHFDTVQMPINVMDAHFRSFNKLVCPAADKAGIGVIAMKSMGAGVILKSKTASPEECLRYTLSQPASVVVTGINSQAVLDQAFGVAKSFKPMTASEISALLGRTAKAADRGEFELFKTSAHFDGTANHPEWMGGETSKVKALGGSA